MKPAHALLTIIWCALMPYGAVQSVEYDQDIPQLAFAAEEIQGALTEANRDDFTVSLTVAPAEISTPQAYRITVSDGTQVSVVGADARGAMYGGLRVAELVRLGLAVTDQEHQPLVQKRGVKINIPIDRRIPAFSDSGEAPQRNIKTMWDYDFWTAYLDDLARYRYNVVSLWAAHPFASLIKLEDYPDVAMDDVHYIDNIQPGMEVDPDQINDAIPGTISVVKKMSIDDKIAYWQKVFAYAESRGIEIVMVHWNIFTYGATGKYGITPEQDNPKTITYLRACIKEMLLTYPQITAIGVCAGENDDMYWRDEFMTEHFLYRSYGKGIEDVRKLQPERQIDLIIRRHSTKYEDINAAFADYTGGDIHASVKYAVAHMYSSRRPQEWEPRIVDEGWLEHYKVWLNLRNDDIFMHRWGSADYAREFVKWIPHEYVPGFLMGSDTYVWGREFISKNPETAGQLEIDKHWYRFRLWGQLAYDNTLSDHYWQAVIQHRFPEVDGALLFQAWESVSEIIPQVNRSVWSPTDGSFGAEACRRTSGFLTLDGYHFDRPAMDLSRIDNGPDSQCISVTDWAKASLAGIELEGVTPLQVAANLDSYAAVGQAALTQLREQMGSNVELRETLNDIESMGFLGRYYADKMRGAAKLALYRESGRQVQEYLDESVAHLEDAVEEWAAYAEVLSRQYRPQKGSRSNTQNWDKTLQWVQKEVQTVAAEKNFPTVSFANVDDGQILELGTDLVVEVATSGGNGAVDTRLRLNGLLLPSVTSVDGVATWTKAIDGSLAALGAGMYTLQAEAIDKKGMKAQSSIVVQVGDADPATADDWKNRIHAVIMQEGEILKQGESRNFPQLECKVELGGDGSLRVKGTDWKTRGKGNRPKWKTAKQPNPYRFWVTFENGQIQINRLKDGGRPQLVIYETPPVEGEGPFQFGITAGKQLVIFHDSEDGPQVVWKAH